MELTAAPAVVRKLNELYKASVLSCQGLSLRLQRFLLDKQRLLDRIQSVTAEKLIFSHAVHTVGGGAAALGRAVMARSPPAHGRHTGPSAQQAPRPRGSPGHTLPETQLSPPVEQEARQLQKGPRQAPSSEAGPSARRAEVLGSFRPRAASASVPVPAGFRLHSRNARPVNVQESHPPLLGHHRPWAVRVAAGRSWNPWLPSTLEVSLDPCMSQAGPDAQVTRTGAVGRPGRDVPPAGGLRSALPQGPAAHGGAAAAAGGPGRRGECGQV